MPDDLTEQHPEFSSSPPLSPGQAAHGPKTRAFFEPYNIVSPGDRRDARLLDTLDTFDAGRTEAVG